jgi:hypothetical protein
MGEPVSHTQAAQMYTKSYRTRGLGSFREVHLEGRVDLGAEAATVSEMATTGNDQKSQTGF